MKYHYPKELKEELFQPAVSDLESMSWDDKTLSPLEAGSALVTFSSTHRKQIEGEEELGRGCKFFLQLGSTP